MTAQAQGIRVSVTIHALLIGAMLAGSAAVAPQQRQILLDFSLGTSVTPAAGVLAANPRIRKAVPAAAPVDRSEPRRVTPMAQSENAAPASADAVPAEAVPSDTREAVPATDGGEGKEGDGETARNRYLETHFAYIRDAIMKRLAYPLVARRMGWSGRVTVSFVLCEDGHVEDVRVRESSGYPVLDRNAVDTIRGIRSFPRPPVRAELIMPVNYRLQ